MKSKPREKAPLTKPLLSDLMERDKAGRKALLEKPSVGLDLCSLPIWIRMPATVTTPISRFHKSKGETSLAGADCSVCPGFAAHSGWMSPRFSARRRLKVGYTDSFSGEPTNNISRCWRKDRRSRSRRIHYQAACRKNTNSKRSDSHRQLWGRFLPERLA